MAETCPKCGYAQVETDECPRCRTFISKYRAYLERLGQEPLPTAGTAAPPGEIVGGRPAGFWIRFVASVLDGIFFSIVGFVIRLVAVILWGSAILQTGVMKVSLFAFNMIFYALYYILMHWKWGQTFGKMALKVRVVTVDGQPITLGASALRYVGYWLSTLTLLIGYIMAGLRSDKRALHDLVAKTRVVRL